MTISEVRKLWDECCASDAPHECPDEEFTRCEVCEASTAARHKLEWEMPRIVELLLQVDDCRLRMLRQSVEAIGKEVVGL